MHTPDKNNLKWITNTNEWREASKKKLKINFNGRESRRTSRQNLRRPYRRTENGRSLQDWQTWSLPLSCRSCSRTLCSDWWCRKWVEVFRLPPVSKQGRPWGTYHPGGWRCCWHLASTGTQWRWGRRHSRLGRRPPRYSYNFHRCRNCQSTILCCLDWNLSSSCLVPCSTRFVADPRTLSPHPWSWSPVQIP